MSLVRSNFARIGLVAALSLLASPLLVFFQYDFTVCTGITLDRPYTPRDTRQLRGDGRIRLVPLDAFPTSTLDALASYYKTKYGLDVELASPLTLPPDVHDPRRKQLVSNLLIKTLQMTHPQPPSERLIVIGLVETDMYIQGVAWRYAISYRDGDRYAVVSTARLDRGCLGIAAVSHERMTSRVRKMVTKNIGVLYFGLPLSDDPRSVLYGNVGGSQELDRMSEDF